MQLRCYAQLCRLVQDSREEAAAPVAAEEDVPLGGEEIEDP